MTPENMTRHTHRRHLSSAHGLGPAALCLLLAATGATGCGSAKTSALGTDGSAGSSGGSSGTSSGGDGTSGSLDVGSTGGPPPTDEGRCPGWTAAVLAEACAALDDPPLPTTRQSLAFEGTLDWDGGAFHYRVNLPELAQAYPDFSFGNIGLTVRFSDGVARPEAGRGLAIFAVDNNLQASYNSNVGFSRYPAIDVSSCPGLRGGWAPNLSVGGPFENPETYSFLLYPEGPFEETKANFPPSTPPSTSSSSPASPPAWA